MKTVHFTSLSTKRIYYSFETLGLIGLLVFFMYSTGNGQGHLPRPVASYPLDDNLLYEEEYGRNGLTQNVALVHTANRFNIPNRAVNFPSYSARISLPNLSSYLDPNKGFSVSFWTKIDEEFTTPSGFKPFTDSDTRYQIFYANTPGNSASTMFGMQRINDRLSINRYLPDKLSKSTWGLWLWDPVAFRTGTTTPQGWYHVILTYFKNGCRVMMWKPGGAAASCSRNYFWPQDIAKATDWGLGSNIASILPIKYLDDIKFYGEPLDDSQSNALHQLESVQTPATPTYCNVSSSTTSDLNISWVFVGKSDSPQLALSTASTDYQLINETFGLSRGTTGVLSCAATQTPGRTPCSTCKYKIQTWIDFNRDGTFQINERVVSEQISQPYALSNTILIPATANLGWTRMRVLVGRSDDLSDLSSCGTLANAQIKDFNVYIYDDSQYTLPDKPCSTTSPLTTQAKVWIQEVKLYASITNIDLVTGDNNPYEDFTGQYSTFYNRPKFRPSDNVTLSLTQATSMTATVVPFTKIWIDFNHNGTFNDSGEEVFVNQSPVLTPVAGSALTTVTGNFTMPNSFVQGITRMRIAVKDRIAPSNCDLTNQFTQDWEVYLENSNNYCVPNERNVTYMWESFGFRQNNLNQNIFIDRSWGPFVNTNTIFQLTKGVNAEVLVSPSYTGSNAVTSNNAFHVKVWVDFNGDGQFDNLPGSDEIIYDSRKTTWNYSDFGIAFVIPTDILDDKVKVRFAFRSIDNADDEFFPCSDVVNGQVIDAELRIVSPTGVVPGARLASIKEDDQESMVEPEKPTLAVYPNPTSGYFIAKIFLPKDETVYFELINLEGKVLGYIQKKLSAGNHEISSRELVDINCNCDGEQTGIQFLKFITPLYKTTRKILIQK